MPMDMDRSLCRALLDEGSLEKIYDAKLDVKTIMGKGRECYLYILDHYTKYSKLPDIETIKDDIDVELEEVTEPLDYYIDKIRERALAYTMMTGMESATENISDKRDIPGAIDELKTTLSKVAQQQESTQERLVNYTASTDMRKEWYEYVEKLDGDIDGIPSGWAKLDQATQGWHNGELITVVARLGVGKTFFALMLAMEAYKQNYKPLVISLEMSTKQLLRRADALYFKKAPKELRQASLGEFGKDAYFEGLDALAGREDEWWFAGSGYVSSTADVDMLITEKKPDIVIVDAFYLLQAAHRHTSNWERVAEVVQEMKKMAQRQDVPIVITTQFSRRAEKKRSGGDEGDVAFADNILQDSDVGLALLPETDPKHEGTMVLKFLKLRDGERRDIRIDWNLDDVSFAEIGYADEHLIPTEEEDGAGSGVVEEY